MEIEASQAAQMEYIPEEILRAAGIYGEPITVWQARYELRDLEQETAVLKNELDGMKKKYEQIKKSLRFSTILFVVFLALRFLMERLYREQVYIYQWLAERGPEYLSTIQMAGGLIRLFRELFYTADSIFLARALYKLYEFFYNGDWKASHWWCERLKLKNLSAEIEQREMRYLQAEERMRKLKQARTMLREQKQEEWREENLPERVVEERALS